MSVAIRTLTAEEGRRERGTLAAILVECVAGGASINFMWPFEQADAEAWWDGVFAAMDRSDIVLFAAYADRTLVGSVQLGLAFPPNQTHRGEVRKLIVSPAARGRGIAADLMAALDAEARRLGRTLLTLDTSTGSDAERLYHRLGWNAVGIVPGMALWPDGRPCDATMFWKAS